MRPEVDSDSTPMPPECKLDLPKEKVHLEEPVALDLDQAWAEAAVAGAQDLEVVVLLAVLDLLLADQEVLSVVLEALLVELDLVLEDSAEVQDQWVWEDLEPWEAWEWVALEWEPSHNKLELLMLLCHKEEL